MVSIKGISAIGVILLFLGLAVSPVMSQTTIRDRLEIGTIGDLASIQLSEQDLTTMEKFLPVLVEKMQTATSYSEKSLRESLRDDYTLAKQAALKKQKRYNLI